MTSNISSNISSNIPTLFVNIQIDEISGKKAPDMISNDTKIGSWSDVAINIEVVDNIEDKINIILDMNDRNGYNIFSPRGVKNT